MDWTASASFVEVSFVHYYNNEQNKDFCVLRRKGFEPLRLAPTELETVSLTTRTPTLSGYTNTESKDKPA